MQPQYNQYPQQNQQFPNQQLPQPQLQPPQQSPYSPPPSPPKGGAGRALKIVGIILISLLLLAGAFGGGLYAATQLAPAAPAATKEETTPVAEKSEDTSHVVLSVGTPVQPKNPVSYTTKIGVPSSLQAVRLSSTNQDSSTGFAIFGNGTFNNELARVAIGNPENPTDNGLSSQVSVTAITKEWLAATGPTDFSQMTASFPSGVPMNTLQNPADKKAFMDALPNATSICAKDETKGIKTDDGTMSICYVTTYGRDGYSPVVTLLGYSNVNSQPAVLFGTVFIHDTSVGSDSTAQQAAIKAAQAGNPTTTTTNAQADILAALKQSGIVITKD